MPSPKRSSATAEQLSRADELTRAGRLSDALAVLEQARETDPFNAHVLLELARIAGRLTLPEAAERCAAAAQEIEPDNHEILIERTVALRALGRHGDAIALLRARLGARPESAELWLALANTVHELGLLEEAEAFLEECLRLKPASAEARANLADLLFDRGEADRALEEYAQALEAAPKNAQMHFNRALLLLHHGDLTAGWREYEWRREIPGRKIERIFAGAAPKPWDGAARQGRSLLLMTEQGLGEQILFGSLIADLIARDDGALLMDCEPRLVALMKRSFPSVEVQPAAPKSIEGRTEINYDWVAACGGAELSIEIGSLPQLLRPALDTFPAPHAPLKPDAAEAKRCRDWLGTLGSGPKIGICWRSGKRGALRDIQYAPLEPWAEFAAETRGELIVVQYDVTDDELSALSEACDRPLHVPPGLDQRNEIDRLAALLSELDAIVTAPTVVGVLGAAVGTPVIKLTHSGSWTALGQSREAFLPAAQIIRPRQAGDWAEVFQLARAALEELLAPV